MPEQTIETPQGDSSLVKFGSRKGCNFKFTLKIHNSILAVEPGRSTDTPGGVICIRSIVLFCGASGPPFETRESASTGPVLCVVHGGRVTAGLQMCWVGDIPRVRSLLHENG